MKQLCSHNEAFQFALKEFAAMCAAKNAELSFPQKHILRITIGKKSLDVSFLPEQPITTATMLRKAMVIFE
jgi:hypothetical protein